MAWTEDGTRLVPRRLTGIDVPDGACDCHMHAYGAPERYPLPATAAFPAVSGGTIDTYLEVRERLGLSRTVVVQPSAYGFDNACTLDAMARLGDTGRGIAIVPLDVEDAEIERLTRLGIRGQRIFMLGTPLFSWDDVEALADRLVPFGWHLQIQFDGRDFAGLAERIAHLPGTVVIDHNGKFLEPVPLDHAGVRALLKLVEGGRCWVKTSGVYETSREGPPDYGDVAALARLLIRTAPERCLFATNWPHPSKPNDVPDDARLVELFAEWCGDAATMRRIMVDNAAELYGFA